MSKSDYIRESLKKSNSMNHYSLFGSEIPIYLKDELVFTDDNSTLEDVIKIVENSLPSFLVSNVDVIYVGDFSFFQEYDTNAAYDHEYAYMMDSHAKRVPFRELFVSVDAIVTAPPDSLIVMFEPAVKANVSEAPKVLPPAVTVLTALILESNCVCILDVTPSR